MHSFHFEPDGLVHEMNADDLVWEPNAQETKERNDWRANKREESRLDGLRYQDVYQSNYVDLVAYLRPV